MKKSNLTLFFAIAIPCFLAVAGFLALLHYYQIKIPYGTWINDIYCTGMTYNEAAEVLLKEDKSNVALDVTDIHDQVHKLQPEKIYYVVSYRDNLEEAVLAAKKSGLFNEQHIIQNSEIHIFEDKWQEYLDTLPLFGDSEKLKTKRFEIIEGADGFILVDHRENTFDEQKASDVLKSAIEDKKTEINLVEEGCYFTPEFSNDDKAVIAEYEALQSFCSRMKLDITIQGKVYKTVDFNVLKNWILLDENGAYVYDKGVSLVLDESKVKLFVGEIEEELNTYWGNPWKFVNHNGDTIEVKAGNLGRVLKTYELEDALLKAFRERTHGAYELTFMFYPKSAEEVDYGAGVGDSYVEVDTLEQHVYLYLNGVCVMDSPCVTGNVSWDMETPKGVFYIEYKQRNRTLRGPDYATPVSYWMHFYDHCGFHDAGWRKKFGEDIYLTDGSHGCVNMPPAKAKELYNHVYKGMPVVIY